MEHSWTRPQGRRRAGEPGGGSASAQAAGRLAAPFLAWPSSQARPPSSRQVSQSASKAGPCVPRAALQGGSGSRRVGGEAGPLRARPGAGRASPLPPPSPSQAGPPDGWGKGWRPSSPVLWHRDVAVAPAFLVSFFLVLSLTSS